MDTHTFDEHRALIERELRERLEHDRTERARPQPSGAPPRLMCLACRGLSAGDARFCTRCGIQFNARVAPALLLAFLLMSAARVWAQPAVSTAPPAEPPVLSTVPTPAGNAAVGAAQMSGMPLQVGDLPPGIVAVRVIRGSFQSNVAGQPVLLRVGNTDRVLSSATGADGRAQFDGLAVGERVRVRADVGGERLESQSFEIPSRGGVRLVLVAGAGAGIAASEPWPSPGPGRRIADAPSTMESLQGTRTSSSNVAPTNDVGWVASVLGVVLIACAAVVHFGRRSPRLRTSFPLATHAPARTSRSELFEQLVRLEHDHEAGCVGAARWREQREALILEIAELDRAAALRAVAEVPSQGTAA